ncbi:MAG: hypothetical protein AVDCRST_MAG45-258 [uncultured Solirubrobacterales bacterium]|uniref:Pyridoxamine 5'-phosphate oxidase putative domain-containing protein n=1 Tax=uncultured Solirubrobacterales bacterium TaxID=768556 RepID=A0A6J4RVG0_9ACTN|nr:MAG: hypothetical protein AVDCRST_MAG45-258 [uncultured Solirubrobacterales bacterium]
MSERPDRGPLPEWPLRAPGLLIVAGPHAIPISTAFRAGDRRLILGLARRRETLERLREDPQAAFAMLAAGIAFTAYGRAGVMREKLEDMPNLAAVELRVDRVQDHLADGRTEMLDQARWRWVSDEAREADATVVAEIEALARTEPGA